MAGNGNWSYSSVSAHNDLSAGAHAVDTFTIHAADGTAASLSFDITGTNDAALISGNTTGNATEAGGLNNGIAGSNATGTLSATDVDGSSAFQAVTAGTAAHGTYSITETGSWTYNLNNTDSAVQSLNAGVPLSDSFTAHTADNTAQIVSITINGANDSATFSGTLSGNVYEDLGTLNATTNAANLSASYANGTATVSDVDSGQSIFNAVTGQNLLGTYGAFTFNNASGAWTYQLDNADPDTNALKTGGTGHDYLTLTSVDGTTTRVDVAVTGHTDHIWAVTQADSAKSTIVGFTAGDYIDVQWGGLPKGAARPIDSNAFIEANADNFTSTYKVSSEATVDKLISATGNKGTDGIADSTQLTFTSNGLDTVVVTLQGYIDPAGMNTMHDNYHIV